MNILSINSLFYFICLIMVPVSLFHYHHHVNSMRMLFGTEVFMEIFAIVLSVVCSSGGRRKEATFLNNVCVKTEGGVK